MDYNHLTDFGSEQKNGWPLDAPRETVYYEALEAGFIDSARHADSEWSPRLLSNYPDKSSNVLAALKHELKTCDRFDFSVAFVANSGITVLLQTLNEALERGIPGRLLTSTYLGFNDPDALEKIRTFPNVELRVFEGPLHTKGYFFAKGSMRTLVVGSSNLTQSALLTNQEWNLLVHSTDQGGIWQSTRSEFESLWAAPETKRVDDAWMDEYRASYVASKRSRTFRSVGSAGPNDQAEALGEQGYQTEVSSSEDITPNAMQEEALANLAALRQRNARRALLISATGIGKTYLAAFDVKAAQAKRVLFVVHRERIAQDALASFKRINGGSRTYGIYSGRRKEAGCDFVFSTIQLLNRHLNDFSANDFDYIIIDETHRAGAESYQRVIDYFEPEFMLGMTATPDRSDGYNIYDLFDNNIAYRITLQKAQAEHMLAPFHYFGIADLSIDDQCSDDPSRFNELTSDQRVDHILKQIDAYSVESRRRGLIFCSRTKEAEELSSLFNARGLRTVALVGGNSNDEERARAIDRLEADSAERADWIEYIFTVDIFNEGVDIPSLNQIIMIRPTESAIIFVQQLGRGLRKYPGKEYVLVLDFIGNYQQNFLIPIALSGDKSYNKDNLRRYIREGIRVVPGCSTINFDRIAEKRIYRALDGGKFGAAKLLKQEYLSLKNMLGRMPSLMDFYENGAMDPQLIFNNKQLGSYHAFLTKYDPDYQVSFTKTQERMLQFVSSKLAAGKRPHELLLVRRLIERGSVPQDRYESDIRSESDALPPSVDSVAAVLAMRFASGAAAASFDRCAFIDFHDGVFAPTEQLVAALQDAEFKRQLEEIVEFGLMKYRLAYANTFDHTNLVLYEKYTYEDVCRLLNWEKNVSGQNIGGYKYDAATNTFPVFINYEKSDDISDTIKYEDRFLSPSRLIAISKQPRYLHSPEIQRLRNSDRTGMKTYLFVRKNKDDNESKEFYFLGTMNPTGNYKEIVMAGTDKPAVEIEYELGIPVRDDLYDYITSGPDDGDD